MSMDFDKLRTLPGTTPEEFDRIREGILALATSETKHYTREEKIDGLVKLAKAVGRYLNAREQLGTATNPGVIIWNNDYYQDALRSLKEAYEEFCEWRHEEPYVVDEIKALMQPGQAPANGGRR